MKTKADKGPKRKKVEFEFQAPDAESVFVVGSFNAWSLQKHPMKKGPEGIWKKAVILAPGDYEYKFWVDGQWREDPLNQRCCANCFGSRNSVVCVRV
ncbi:MAG: glycogen-binding domain-containing protein [Desulfatitalea sp.]|nr:glycogen-binding domain-containing protein [Desulfatitalea sp.]